MDRLSLPEHKHFLEVVAHQFLSHALSHQQIVLSNCSFPLLELTINFAQLTVWEHFEPSRKGKLHFLFDGGMLLMIEEAVERQVVMEGAFIVVVDIAEDVDVARDVFWIVDEGNCRVLEDKLIVIENVADHADQFAAFREKRRVKLFVYSNQPKQFGQLLPLAEQVKASEAGQLAVIEVDDLTGKL